MAGFCGGKKAAILLERWNVNVIPRIVLENSPISRASDVCICKHPPHFCITTEIIPFVISSESTIKGILGAMNRALVTLCLRNMEQNHFVSIYFSHFNIVIL